MVIIQRPISRTCVLLLFFFWKLSKWSGPAEPAQTEMGWLENKFQLLWVFSLFKSKSLFPVLVINHNINFGCIFYYTFWVHYVRLGFYRSFFECSSFWPYIPPLKDHRLGAFLKSSIRFCYTISRENNYTNFILKKF
jgi:hypothetical protein